MEKLLNSQLKNNIGRFTTKSAKKLLIQFDKSSQKELQTYIQRKGWDIKTFQNDLVLTWGKKRATCAEILRFDEKIQQNIYIITSKKKTQKLIKDIEEILKKNTIPENYQNPLQYIFHHDQTKKTTKTYKQEDWEKKIQLCKQGKYIKKTMITPKLQFIHDHTQVQVQEEEEYYNTQRLYGHKSSENDDNYNNEERSSDDQNYYKQQKKIILERIKEVPEFWDNPPAVVWQYCRDVEYQNLVKKWREDTTHQLKAVQYQIGDCVRYRGSVFKEVEDIIKNELKGDQNIQQMMNKLKKISKTRVKRCYRQQTLKYIKKKHFKQEAHRLSEGVFKLFEIQQKKLKQSCIDLISKNINQIKDYAKQINKYSFENDEFVEMLMQLKIKQKRELIGAIKNTKYQIDFIDEVFYIKDDYKKNILFEDNNRLINKEAEPRTCHTKNNESFAGSDDNSLEQIIILYYK